MRLIASMGMRAGGRPGAPLRPWLVELDPDAGRVVRQLALPFDPERASGPDADDEATRPSLLDQGVILQPTHGQLFWVCPERWQVIDAFSHPLMHSTHSACPTSDGGFVLACAGNESVLAFDRRDQLVGHHFLRGGSFEDAFPGVTDFRRAHHDAFKPHTHHPSCAFEAAGALWATCFETGAAVALDGSGRRIALDGMPHDGSLQEGRLWFTTVDGRAIAVDPDSLVPVDVVDLPALSGTDRMLGWCRGIAVAGNRLWLGMTQLRSTTHREVLRVLLRGERGRKLPSRVVEVDLEQRRIVRETVVGNEAGGTIYGLTALPG